MNEEKIEELKIGGIVKGPKQKKKGVFIGILIVLLVILAVGGFAVYKLLKDKPNKEPETQENNTEKTDYSIYRMNNNELSYFDLSFLKLENKEKNMIYSPLSIKYTLDMLREGSDGETKKQIENIMGDYSSHKYANSENMSFANALFVKDTYRKNIKDSYVETLKNKYDAEVVYDSFKSPDIANKWVKDKTFNLIDGVFDDISDFNFILANALAIDMEWNQYIQATVDTVRNLYDVTYNHERYNDYINLIMDDSYGYIEFNNKKMSAKAVSFGASINKYDIVKEVGEDNIRAKIKEEYEKWENAGGCGEGTLFEDSLSFANKYIAEIDKNYNQVNVSTDFKFYTDDNVKIFEKELKEYNGTTLEYIALMPNKVDLKEFINSNDQNSINEMIGKLKTVEANNFEDGKVYKIVGGVPLFDYDYELDFIKDLNNLGISDVFTKGKADLSKMAEGNDAFIGEAVHKANIKFSNEGIKAAAVTAEGGFGSSNCGFEYLYDVPVEVIDLIFDNPFMYIIRDKNTKEVWFVGNVYEPTVDLSHSYNVNGRLTN